jgi:hypothetical protein
MLEPSGGWNGREEEIKESGMILGVLTRATEWSSTVLPFIENMGG